MKKASWLNGFGTPLAATAGKQRVHRDRPRTVPTRRRITTFEHFEEPGWLLRVMLLWLSFTALLSVPPSANSQDLLNDNPTYSPFNLELRPFVTLPSNGSRIIGMTTRRGDTRLYVTSEL